MSDEEVSKVVQFLKDNMSGEVNYDESITETAIASKSRLDRQQNSRMTEIHYLQMQDDFVIEKRERFNWNVTKTV